MKIFLIILVIIGNILHASDIELESAIFNKVLRAVTAKEHPKVCIYKSNKALETYPGAIEIVTQCSEADVVLLSTLKNLPVTCKDKVLFGTRYSQLKNPDVVGAFFWQKGRPNILFYDYRLKKHHIKLDKSFDKYIEK
ncbi:hypothetical protein [Sulfurimonas paralvinellae]|uniref:Uncharacterized protein n=1 Tax=Sulfurimonas paralvinellae TaxID=317658 RepID=A0A7M1B842_9BACT|nr:hypothetical protein [Sulfurimonas paralvinellae]QOP45919.1 hypothetical protein FM071_06290 [Sulfurimonas paralvinellae]